MRNTFTLLAAGCALLGTVAVQAQLLPITGVTPASLSFTPGVGGNFVFTGTITNGTGTTIEGGVPGLALNPLPMDVTSDTTDFTLAFGAPPIAPNGTYMGTLFSLNIGPAQRDPFDVRFEVQGLDGNGNNVPGATGVFELRVGAAANVPEPGSMALLAGGLISGGMLVLRRRRK